jgi:hypothetical protein
MVESTFDKAVKAKEKQGKVIRLSVKVSRKIDQMISDALCRTIPGRGITPYKHT